MSTNEIFELQKQHAFIWKNSTVKERRNLLKRFANGLTKHESALTEALRKDLNKHAFESIITEFALIYSEINAVSEELGKWMRPKSPGINWANPFSRSLLIPESKGVCLILAPWNYPVQLTLAPLVSCLAAGNTAILKPSEFTPNVSEALRVFVSDTFHSKEVHVETGDATVAQQLLALPFNHIFFTGSPAVGKKVMAAAANHLTSVTLELGGKSPVFIDEGYNLRDAAKKIVWGKFTNAGQTCIAPDYVLLPKGQAKTFAAHVQAEYEKRYTLNGELNTDECVSIVSEKHYNRLVDLVASAKSAGTEVLFEGKSSSSSRHFGLTLLLNPKEELAVSQEEIFGPILPIYEYHSAEEAVQFVRKKEKPLALYLFSNKRRKSAFFLFNTWSGGVTHNDVFLHLSDVRMPFGGANFSGHGYSHGYYGFLEFTHLRAYVKAPRWFNTTALVYPPYKGREWLANLLRKFM